MRAHAGAVLYSLSPPSGERVGVRGRFSTRRTPNFRSSRVPALAGVSRDWAHIRSLSRAGGNPATCRMLSAAKRIRIVPAPCTRKRSGARACAAGFDAQIESGGSARWRLLSWSTATRKLPEGLRQSSLGDDSYSALLTCGGFHPQAIHGLWERPFRPWPRLMPVRAGGCSLDKSSGRSQTGGTSQATAATSKSKGKSVATLCI